MLTAVVVTICRPLAKKKNVAANISGTTELLRKFRNVWKVTTSRTPYVVLYSRSVRAKLIVEV